VLITKAVRNAISDHVQQETALFPLSVSYASCTSACKTSVNKKIQIPGVQGGAFRYCVSFPFHHNAHASRSHPRVLHIPHILNRPPRPACSASTSKRNVIHPSVPPGCFQHCHRRHVTPQLWRPQDMSVITASVPDPPPSVANLRGCGGEQRGVA